MLFSIHSSLVYIVYTEIRHWVLSTDTRLGTYLTQFLGQSLFPLCQDTVDSLFILEYIQG